MRSSAKLSVLDQRKPIMHQSLLFCFSSHDPEKTAKAVIRGIQRTAIQFPYLTGEISQGEDQGFTCISWDDGDSLQVERKDNQGLPSYEELRVQGMPLHCVPSDLRPTGACANSRPDLGSIPAFLSSYTVIDGGVILCLSFHHHLVDGLGIGDILAVIADNTAGRVSTSRHDHQAILSRYEDVNKALGLERSIAATTSKLDFLPVYGASLPGKSDLNFSLLPRMFTFSVQALEVLRDTFVSQLGVRQPSMVGLISCLLWMAISDVRSKRQSAESDTIGPHTTTLILAMNARTSFPKDSYFNSANFVGNLSDGVPITKPIDDLSIPSSISKPTNAAIASILVRPLQYLVQSLTAASTLANIKASYQRTLDVPDVRATRDCLSLPPNTITLTSYASFPWYFDFGPDVGKVEFGRFATAMGEGIDGATVLLPRKREQKGADEVIEAFLKLRDEDMAALEKHDWLTPFFAKKPF